MTSEAKTPQSSLTGRLGIELSAEMIGLALTHRSYAYENGGLPTNERLEFLGDSVLGLVVTDTLYRSHPDLAEGQLAKMRSSVVNSRSLAQVARGIGLGGEIRLGRGELTTGGPDKSSILADTVEAIIGATFLECGLPIATALVHRLFDPLIARAAELGAGLDWKTSLQELTAADGLGVPEYVVTQSGLDHDKSFNAKVKLRADTYGSGIGRTKKEAEQRAAQASWHQITSARALGSAPGARTS